MIGMLLPIKPHVDIPVNDDWVDAKLAEMTSEWEREPEPVWRSLEASKQ
jgi:hypothetical protein